MFQEIFVVTYLLALVLSLALTVAILIKTSECVDVVNRFRTEKRELSHYLTVGDIIISIASSFIPIINIIAVAVNISLLIRLKYYLALWKGDFDR